MAASVLVFDASATVTYLKARPGAATITAQMLDPGVEIYQHRQNATEVWYQMHRQGALTRFLAANPARIAPDGRPNLTDAEFSDPAIFDALAGEHFADQALARVEGTGVQIVGDETFPDLWKRAAALKSTYRRVSLADCFGVALAIELSAPFWSSDRHELQVLHDAGAVQVHFFR